jgi:hypothetical protein
MGCSHLSCDHSSSHSLTIPGKPMKSAKRLTLDFSEIRITDTFRVKALSHRSP